jgi:hypothetical protein
MQQSGVILGWLKRLQKCPLLMWDPLELMRSFSLKPRGKDLWRKQGQEKTEVQCRLTCPSLLDWASWKCFWKNWKCVYLLENIHSMFIKDCSGKLLASFKDCSCHPYLSFTVWRKWVMTMFLIYESSVFSINTAVSWVKQNMWNLDRWKNKQKMIIWTIKEFCATWKTHQGITFLHNKYFNFY